MASFSIKDLEESIERSDDAFGKRIADGVRNELDIASHYTFSPERLRLFKNDSRQFLQYNNNSLPGFSDDPDVWTLTPNASESLQIESAESVTYVVNYGVQSSAAFQVNRSLQDGDLIKVGPRSTDDGWFMEQNGTKHADDEVDIVELRNGTRTLLAENQTLPRPTTDFTRYETEWSWYNVGNQKWTQTYTNQGEQENEEYAKTSNDGGRGPEKGNLNLWQEIERGADADPIAYSAGSMGMVTLGRPAALTRSKPQNVTVDLPNTNDTWLPVYAIRIDPEHPVANARLRALDIISYANNAFLELVAVSFSADKTDIPDGDWELPEYHHDQNSIFQEAVAGTDSVYDVADDTGTVKTLGSSDKFGGFTIASSSITSGGNVVNTQGDFGAAVEAKKSILGSDHVVFLARTASAGATLRFTWAADQDW